MYILKTEKNLGVAAANNISIKKAKELEIDCILLSNYDISIDDNLLIERKCIMSIKMESV